MIAFIHIYISSLSLCFLNNIPVWGFQGILGEDLTVHFPRFFQGGLDTSQEGGEGLREGRRGRAYLCSRTRSLSSGPDMWAHLVRGPSRSIYKRKQVHDQPEKAHCLGITEGALARLRNTHTFRHGTASKVLGFQNSRHGLEKQKRHQKNQPC